jgi:hypothetical protein
MTCISETLNGDLGFRWGYLLYSRTALIDTAKS